MIKIKVLAIPLFSIFLFMFGIYAIPGIPDYLAYKKVAESAVPSGNMLEAGRVLVVKPCVRDTPLPALGPECAASCPLVNATLKVACAKPVSDALTCITAAQSAGHSPAVDCANPIKKAVECLACDLYYEVPISEAQKGNLFLGIPKTFTNYKGGGTFPMPGNQFIWMGSSNLSPYVMGVPGVVAARTKNVVDFFSDPVDFIIAGIKDIGN